MGAQKSLATVSKGVESHVEDAWKSPARDGTD